MARSGFNRDLWNLSTQFLKANMDSYKTGQEITTGVLVMAYNDSIMAELGYTPSEASRIKKSIGGYQPHNMKAAITNILKRFEEGGSVEVKDSESRPSYRLSVMLRERMNKGHYVGTRHMMQAPKYSEGRSELRKAVAPNE